MEFVSVQLSRVNIILKAILGFIFVITGILKLFSLDSFSLEVKMILEFFSSTRVNDLTTFYFSCFFSIFEVALGIALLFTKHFFQHISIITILGFIIANSIQLIIGKSENCGCFGDLLILNPSNTLIIDFIMLFINLYLIRYSYNLFFLDNKREV